ncbi:hypothetical protein [Xenophilus azovorans]|jgi:hypothetical protein|uniref:hypothetical protein n=1 Tax=Xenophilus azovorans TaxID=151755 RepID=UPI000571BBA8|nr:hypothetical protein [Xenophilus azovorans]
MNHLISPSSALRPQRGGLRQKPHFAAARPRAAGHAAPSGALNAAGAAADCVFKRMPSIGDTAAHAVSARW